MKSYDFLIENQTYIPSYATKITVDILNQADIIIRVLLLIVHMFYFFLIFKIKQFRRLSLVYMHHSNLIGLVFNLHYLVYFDNVYPKFENLVYVDLACKISENLWALIKILRAYSIALIALHRLIAVFRINLYKKINKSVFFLIFPIILIYFFVIFFIIATKFYFNTTYGSLYCFDGYSKIFKNKLMYFIWHSSMGLIFPTIFGMIAYYLIHRKIEHLRQFELDSLVAVCNKGKKITSFMN
jgi:hypothetical protein